MGLLAYINEYTPILISISPLTAQTYNVDRQTADSAGTATAFLCGVKANRGTLGVDSRVAREDCSVYTANPDTHVDSILDWSLAAGIIASCCGRVRPVLVLPVPVLIG